MTFCTVSLQHFCDSVTIMFTFIIILLLLLLWLLSSCAADPWPPGICAERARTAVLLSIQHESSRAVARSLWSQEAAIKDTRSRCRLRALPLQGDHLYGKPGNVRNFDSCHWNVGNLTESQGNVREKILWGKSGLKLLNSYPHHWQ